MDEAKTELDADRQEWLCGGEKVAPLVSFGLHKTCFLHRTLYHAGDAEIAAFRNGARVESRVQRVTMKVESGTLHKFYDLISEEGRFERIPGNCVVQPHRKASSNPIVLTTMRQASLASPGRSRRSSGPDQALANRRTGAGTTTGSWTRAC